MITAKANDETAIGGDLNILSIDDQTVRSGWQFTARKTALLWQPVKLKPANAWWCEWFWSRRFDWCNGFFRGFAGGCDAASRQQHQAKDGKRIAHTNHWLSAAFVAISGVA